jgi:hypothetical protein
MTPERAIVVAWVLWVVSWVAAAAWSDPAANRPSYREQALYRAVTLLGAFLLFVRLGRLYQGRFSLGIWRGNRLAACSGSGLGLWLRLVGAALSRSALVEFGHEEGQPPRRRHGALRDRPPPDLHRPHRRLLRDRAVERHAGRHCRRHSNDTGLFDQGEAGGTFPARATGPGRL